jgi:hypothetical protein
MILVFFESFVNNISLIIASYKGAACCVAGWLAVAKLTV